MNEGIKFSIGIPAYKSEHLSECILSILDQSYSEFELIIINDFSPHPIDEIVEKFKDSRIRYYKNDKNTGAEKVVINFNKCLEKASGDFFVLFGDDDKMEPDYLEEFSKLVLHYPDLDVFHCRSKIIDENSKPVLLTASWPEFESVYDNIWHRVSENRIMFIPDFVYRVSALKKNGGYYYLPLAWGTDNITAYIAAGKKGIAHTNKTVLNYRRHPVNISSLGNHELKMDAIMQMQLWFNDFLKTRPEKDDDLIIYNYLLDNMDRLMQKQKVYTISSSLSTGFLKNIFNWFNKRRKYKISVSEIIYSSLIYLKEKRVKRMY